MRKLRYFSRPSCEAYDAISQNARGKLEITGEPAMPCVLRIRITTAKTLTQNVAVSKGGQEEGDPASEFFRVNASRVLPPRSRFPKQKENEKKNEKNRHILIIV